MNVLFACSEAKPFIKTGGLADVGGSLPPALRSIGIDARLILPAYPQAVERAKNVRSLGKLVLPNWIRNVEILEGCSPCGDTPVYFVSSPEHFDRSGHPYVSNSGADWPDNANRFAVLSRAIAAIGLGQDLINWRPSLVHCNDWQTGLVPAFLAKEKVRPKTLFTVHNIAYQGRYSLQEFDPRVLSEELASDPDLEFFGNLSFMKAGLVFSDWITTVSPTYAKEIRTPEFGFGLEGILQEHVDRLTGIINGTDYRIWNPSNDIFISHHYDAQNINKKTGNKADLQNTFGLPLDNKAMLLGHIGRLIDQKGADLIIDSLDKLTELSVQLVVLGTGSRELERLLKDAANRHENKIAVHIGYDEKLAHLITAGSDCVLMPSRVEPCGLNQLYGLKYGSVPIVRHTGGLADSVIDATLENIARNVATGFQFHNPTPEAFVEAVERALNIYQQSKDTWKQLISACMRQDYSWESRAAEYANLYGKL